MTVRLEHDRGQAAGLQSQRGGHAGQSAAEHRDVLAPLTGARPTGLWAYRLMFLNESSEHPFKLELAGMVVNATLTIVTSAAGRLS